MLKVSVIIPFYNTPGINECIKALERQRNRGFEVIVVDDGSDRREGERVEKLLGKSPLKIRFIRSVHRGPAHARNLGAKHAKGEVLLFTDADCVPGDRWIDEMLRGFGRKGVAGVGGSYRTLNKESLVARFTGYEIALRHERLGRSGRVDFIGTFSAGYMKDTFLEEGGFDTGFKAASGEDPDLSFRLAKRGFRLAFAPGAWVWHRHPDSLGRYLKQKFRRGFWRVALYRKHPGKAAGESYTPLYVNVQIPMALLAPALLPFYYPASLALLCAMLLLNFIEGARMARFEKKMLLAAPLILTLRSFASAAGVVCGALSALSGRGRKR